MALVVTHVILIRSQKLTWPSAGRALALLEGAKVQLDNAAPITAVGERKKRLADDAFGQEKTLPRQVFGPVDQEHLSTLDCPPGMQDMSDNILAHVLGLDTPGIEPSTSYYPGYQWWPRSSQGASPVYEQTPDLITPRPYNDHVPGVFDAQVNQQLHWPPSGDPGIGIASDSTSNYSFDFSGMPNQFGFN